MPGADAQQIEQPDSGSGQRPPRRRWRSRAALGVAAVALVGGGAAWLSRERIASDLIDDYLQRNGVAATYDIVSISPRQQVIENLVIGDPARPDLTVRRMVVETGVGWAGPELRRLTVDGARAFASFRGGTFSLGALDPLLFTGSDAPPALPAIDISLTDARALVESDYGRIGVKLDGAGRLDDGFAGTLAATAPGLGVADCRAETATLYGKLTTNQGAPELDGPLRLSGLACAGASLARADVGTRMSLKPDFTAAAADLRIEGQRARFADISGAAAAGTVRIDWSQGRLAVGHEVALTGLSSPQGRLARAALEGSWRGVDDGSSGQWEGSLRGTDLQPASNLSASLADAERGLEGTLLAPLLAQTRTSLTRVLDGAAIRADAILRHKGSTATLIVPEASLAARNGTRVLALSRASAAIGAQGLSQIRGSLLAGGEGLPAINGRVEQQAGGRWTARLAMADYAAGKNRIAVPRLALRGGPDGAFAFEGLATASGDLPGGGVTDLTLPLDGTWSDAGGLALGSRCMPVRFAGLALSGLVLTGQQITLCPEGGAPMLSYRESLRLAARTGPISLSGKLGENPASLAASRIVLRYPQPFALEGLTARIGDGDSEMRLAAASLTGSLAGEIAGAFQGGSARLAAVPLDLGAISGSWRFADGAVQVSEGAFTLTDRPEAGQARFFPLIATGASLTLADNRITADALLRHPESGRSVTQVALTHDLDTAAGSARISVPGLVFDKGLQPDQLSYLAQGVIALADGTITGGGRVDWNGDAITSSGTFGSEGVDFAAAFGPVRGLSGKVTFTDLLNLTTAPDQRVTIAAINPGVEVLAGTVQFEVKDGTLLTLEDARFPFMGGSLVMRPLVMDFSQPEARRYVFELTGLDAATFVAEMELTNLSATGTFDGTVPIIFDKDGNGRIEGGLLLSRTGGGNLAYIGELTYENLGAMGNYAFSALRSLDYRQMRITLDGDLAGEIITSFDFDGVRQGAGTSQNFITRRLAKLPIQFKINVRSQSFSQLAIIARGYSDPTAWGDPFSMGLVRIENGKLIMRERGEGVPATPPPEPQTVQPPESDPLP
jgi:translocation and assembly module TamB